MILPSFAVLQRNYPAGSDPDAVRMAIGGEIARLPLRSNTCVIRMSRALNYAGKAYEIPKHPRNNTRLLTYAGGDGKNYAVRVAEFLRYLRGRYGPPNVSTRYKSAAEIESVTPFLNQTGIIAWHVQGWDDATGHFTLWDGKNGLYEGGENYFSTEFFPRTVQTAAGPRTIWETGIDLWRC